MGRPRLGAGAQVSLGELLAVRPLQQGLAELVAYLQLASDAPNSVVDEATLESVQWLARDGMTRRASLPRIIFVSS